MRLLVTADGVLLTIPDGWTQWRAGAWRRSEALVVLSWADWVALHGEPKP